MYKTILSLSTALLLMIAVSCGKTDNLADTGLETGTSKKNTDTTSQSPFVDTANTIRLTVASRNADCMGVDQQKCFLVKEGDKKEWCLFYSNIGGFDFESGYEYVLAVKTSRLRIATEDASPTKYTLARVLSKTKRDSENLPPLVH